VTASCTRSFAGRPESVSAARAWVAGFLPGSPAADDVALLTSELFTNAVLYSASRLPGGLVTVSVRTGNGSVRVDVIDQGDVPPGRAASRGLGAGLAIVRELADVFGADGPDRWFTLRTGGVSCDEKPALPADWQAQLDAELTEMRETTRRIYRLACGRHGAR
jgi:anti-sigma regulatory factor (Ser/Thr protein kinase)